MPTIELQIHPRPQFRPYLERKQRFSCLVCHRRAGKTYSCLQDILARALTSKRPGPPLRFGYIAPTRDQAKDIAWGYLQKFVQPLPGVTVNQAELSLRLHNEAQIRLYSGDSYDRMRGLYFDGVVIDEPADIESDAWSAVIRPCLTDYRGWATFIGTPKGKNSFYTRWVEATGNPQEWFSLILKASESGIIPPDELASLMAGTPEHLFKQEYECDFTVPMPGAIYAPAIETARNQGRICSMPVAGDSLVHTSWDLGSPRHTIVWYWQIVGREIRVIDCDLGFEGTLTERAAMMIAKGYNYGTHYLPHDAMQTERTGSNFAAEIRQAGLKNLVCVPRTASVWIGINHTLELMPSMVWRNTATVEKGLEALAAYRQHIEGAGALTRAEPVHDWASHPADALRTMSEAHRAGLFRFASAAQPRPDEYRPGGGHVRKGMKARRVSA